MSYLPYHFQIPKSRDIGDIIAAFQHYFSSEKTREFHIQRAYYDSFDWRLYQAGYQLLSISDPQQEWLKLMESQNQLIMEKPTEEIPAFADQLPDCPIRATILPLLEMRALLPQTKITSLCREIAITNDENKRVLTVHIEDHWLPPEEKSAKRSLGTTLTLYAIKGYEKPLNQALQLVTKELDLKQANTPLFEKALSAVGRQAVDYSSKMDVELDHTMRSDAATRIIMRHLLGVLAANLDGTKQATDTEFLHDFRVAVRRTRAALSQIKHVFPDDITRDFKARFAWLGQITSLPRDLDVYLLKYPEYEASLPTEMHQDLAPLAVYLQQKRTLAHKELVKQLNGSEYKTLIKDWNTFLNSPLPDQSSESAAMQPIQNTANKGIWKMYRKAIQEGRTITDESKPESLHDLRKTCKKLRYLMEFFQALYPRKNIRARIKTLKKLQENLGNFQDYSVQEQNLRLFSQEMLETGKAPAETLLALGVLVKQIHNERDIERAAFAKNFAQFDTPEQEDSFKALLSE